MFGRQKTGSVLCPSCGQLVGVNDEECLGCGRKRPGMWGLAGPLRMLAQGDGFVSFLMWACVAVYLAMLAADPSRIQMDGLAILAPSRASLFRFGAAGAIPVAYLERWWTPLSAGWLHGGLIHIAFNLMSIRQLGPIVTELYGASRTVLIYVLGSVAGFVLSTAAGYWSWPLSGRWTLGASAAVFALIGAVLYYGKRGGSSRARDAAVQWIVSGAVMGFLFLGTIDNYAHLGGLGGGYLVALWLDPLKQERGNHTVLAFIALGLSLGAVILSLAMPLPPYVLELLLQ